MSLRPAIFLDRDGTIIEDVGYLSRIEQVRLFPEAAATIRAFNQTGRAVILVTNQSGVGRGFFPESRVEEVHAHLRSLLAQHDARIDAIYYCPHHPDEGCDCRKPKPGMLLRAAREWQLDLSRSVMFGDKADDVAAGEAAGCRACRVTAGLQLRHVESVS